MTNDGETPAETRSVSDQLLEIMDRLRSVEERKRRAPLGSDEFVALAEEAETQGRLVFRWTGVQLEMARHAASRLARGELQPEVRLVDVEPRPLTRILAAWREAQIRFEMAKPGTPEATEALEAIERLREEYRAVAAAKLDGDRNGREPLRVDTRGGQTWADR
jgi:hypothetical protein